MNKLERDKKLKILLPILILISGLVWAPNILSGSKEKVKQKGSSEKSQGVQVFERASATVSLADAKQRIKSAYTTWGRNPFIEKDWQPKKTREVVLDNDEELEKIVEQEEIEPVHPSDSIVLKGIFWNQQKPSALLNNEVVGQGTTIGNYEVVDISPDKVVLSDGVDEYIFTMQE